MNKLSAIIGLFLCSFFNSIAQDTIITVEGDKIVGRAIKMSHPTNECFYENKSGNEKEIDIDEIYSIRDSSGKETVYYKQDTLKGFYNNPEEMQQYIAGILDAKKTFKSPVTTYVGAGLSVSAVAAIGLTGGGLLFWTPVIPVGYAGVMLTSKPDVEKITQTIPEPKRNEKYITGYVTQVKKKRVNNAIMGSLGALLLGWVVYLPLTGM